MDFTRSTVASVRKKYRAVASRLDERSRRVWAGAEAESLKRGGITIVSKATGLSRTTIYVGMAEIAHKKKREETTDRIRRSGGGRKSLTERDPTLEKDLRALVDPLTRGDPGCLLRWMCKSASHIAGVLRRQGHVISERSVSNLLHSLGYSMQTNRKTQEGKNHPDRDAQFHHINDTGMEYIKHRQPVISVDAKKRELIGNFKNAGQEWSPKGKPTEVAMHDFPDSELGKVTPYGVYDFKRNEGWVNVGIYHNTAAFAVESIRRWWIHMGKKRYPKASKLLITADSGGSNASRSWLWKMELQKLADETKLTLHVCHFPPGTSKWNKIEHRLFSYITQNWRGKPLLNCGMVVQLIGHVKTKAGLTVRAMLDENVYVTGIKVSMDDMKKLWIEPEIFHPEWNYTIRPRKKH